MKKSTIYLYIISFIIGCVISTPLYMLIGKYLDSENYENRDLMVAPTLNLSTVTSFPKKYESYFNDRVPFRNQMIKVNSLIDFFIFKESPVEQVIIGKEGWLFYNPRGKDGDPIGDVTGKNSINEEDLEKKAKRLLDIRDELREKGKEVIFVIAPNKESIYGKEYLPGTYCIIEETRMDLIVSYLQKYTDLTIVYPKKELLLAKEQISNKLLYYKTDTHWNDIGAYIGAKNILSVLGIKLPDLEDVEIIENKEFSGDLANMMAMTKYLNYDKVYKIDKYSNNINFTVEQIVKGNANIIHYTSENQDFRKVFLVHDSFSVSMLPYIRTQFSDLYTVHLNSYSSEYLDQINPDIIIFEVVERYGDLLFSINI